MADDLSCVTDERDEPWVSIADGRDFELEDTGNWSNGEATEEDETGDADDNIYEGEEEGGGGGVEEDDEEEHEDVSVEGQEGDEEESEEEGVVEGVEDVC